MIIKPDLGSRIFWGVAGVTLLIIGCSTSTPVLPLKHRNDICKPSAMLFRFDFTIWGSHWWVIGSHYMHKCAQTQKENFPHSKHPRSFLQDAMRGTMWTLRQSLQSQGKHLPRGLIPSASPLRNILPEPAK